MTKRRRPTAKEIAEYIARPYTRMLVPDPDDGGYLAEVLEVPGAISAGDTPEEALAMVDDALGGVIGAMLARGDKVPEPMGLNEYSGKFVTRISSELHRQAANRAGAEGVSLNQWVGLAIAERLTGKDLAGEVVEKVLSALQDAEDGTRRRRRPLSARKAS